MPFISDEYTATNAPVDNYEVDRQKIRDMGLSYAYRDNAGNRIWEDENGHLYDAYQLAKRDSMGRAASGNADTIGKGSSGSNDNNQYNPYGVADSSQSTQLPTPIIYNPVQTSSNTSNTPNQSPSKYPKGHVADKSATTNKLPVTNTRYMVTRGKPIKSNFETQSSNRINSTQNPPMEVEYTSKGTAKGPPKKKDDCDRKSSFYLLDRNGKKPDSATNDFFRDLNARAGGIFKLCPDGKVLIQKDKSIKNVEGKVSEEVSYILAKTIANAIKGGFLYNGSMFSHDIKLKIRDPRNAEERQLRIPDNPDSDFDFKNQVYYDAFDKSVIDWSDYRNCLAKGLSSTTEEQRKSLKFFKNEIIQASAIGHFIVEMSGFTFLKEDNSKISKKEYKGYHNKAITRECEIISEMTKLKITPQVRYSILLQRVPNRGLVIRKSVYLVKDKGAIIINNFVKEYENQPLGDVFSAEIYYDKNYVLDKNKVIKDAEDDK